MSSYLRSQCYQFLMTIHYLEIWEKEKKDECTRKNVKKLSNNDVDFITDEVYRRNQIEVIEDTTDYHFDMIDDDISLESLD